MCHLTPNPAPQAIQSPIDCIPKTPQRQAGPRQSPGMCSLTFNPASQTTQGPIDTLPNFQFSIPLTPPSPRPQLPLQSPSSTNPRTTTASPPKPKTADSSTSPTPTTLAPNSPTKTTPSPPSPPNAPTMIPYANPPSTTSATAPQNHPAELEMPCFHDLTKFEDL